jgi:N-methylhydantoinase B/oxoprolinase/acetone carboxylase alpha subunit
VGALGARIVRQARRTSFSTLVNESEDFACADRCGGQSLAEDAEGTPSFIGTLPVTVNASRGDRDAQLEAALARLLVSRSHVGRSQSTVWSDESR